MNLPRFWTVLSSGLFLACLSPAKTAARPPPTVQQANQALRPTPAPAPKVTPSSAASHLKMGQSAPTFRIRALDGAMVRLDEFAYSGREKSYAKKRPVLLDFFRTDCQPCLDAMPQLVELHKKYSGAGLQIILVALIDKGDLSDRSISAGERALSSFLERNRFPFLVVKDGTDHVAQKYMGESISLPATFLIDRNGKLRKAKFSAKGDLGSYFGPTLNAVLGEHTAARAP